MKFQVIYKVVTALHVHNLLANKLPSSFDNFFPWSTIHNMTELHVNITTYHKHLPEHNFPPVHHTMQSQLYGIICNCPHKQQNREQVSRKITQQIMTRYNIRSYLQQPQMSRLSNLDHNIITQWLTDHISSPHSS